MNRIADMRLMLSKCKDCLGCNRLEQENFGGDNNCKNYRKGVTEAEKNKMREEQMQKQMGLFNY